MESNHIHYNYEKSIERIDKILDTSDNAYEERKDIPKRDKLTHTNGFYVNPSALFVDIRDSSSLSSEYRRPKIAKLYRAYISEVVAIINGNTTCVEINIVGDGVSGIFNTKTTFDINTLFSTAFSISSLVDILNCKLQKKDIRPITVGIGISDGRALMIKAGYSGSGISDIVWMGDVVNEASKLADYGNKTYMDHEIMVSKKIYDDLNDHNQSLLEFNYNRNCYHGNVVNLAMNEWYKENCE